MAKTAVSVTADAPGVNVHVLEVEAMHTNGAEDQWSKLSPGSASAWKVMGLPAGTSTEHTVEPAPVLLQENPTAGARTRFVPKLKTKPWSMLLATTTVTRVLRVKVAVTDFAALVVT